MSQIGLHSLRDCHKLRNSYLETVSRSGSELLGDRASQWVTVTWRLCLALGQSYLETGPHTGLHSLRKCLKLRYFTSSEDCLWGQCVLRYWLNLDETAFIICRNLNHIVLFHSTLNLLQNYSAKSTFTSLMFVTTVFNHIRPGVTILLHMRSQRLYRVVAYPYATTVQSCCILICNDCTELLALHTCSIPLFLVRAVISIIVLFVAILRLWPVLETVLIYLMIMVNRPLARGEGHADRALVR